MNTHSRKRPTANSSQLMSADVLHSTVIEHSKRPRIHNIPDSIVISAPSGFPDFSTVLQKHGFILAKPRNNLVTDELTFRKSLSDWISENEKVVPITKETNMFVSSMMSYLSIKENLIHAMTPTMHRDEVFQSSLLHNLLAVEYLQPHVFTVLFPVLIETAYIASKHEDVDLAITILNQLKWMPHLVEEESYVSSLLDMVENATAVAQKEMIRFLPDIIPERLHPKVGEMLRKLLDKGTQVVSSIMDCFSGLDISDHEWAKIRETALDQLFNAPLQDFPAYFGFLFRTLDPLILTEIIMGMREKLEITPIGRDVKNNAYMTEIVDKIEFCCSINHQLVLVWTKLVRDDLIMGEEVKPLDLMMLLIFGESFKSSLTSLKLLFANYNLTLKLLDYMLENNMPVLNKVFVTFSKFCDSILRTKETESHKIVEVILVKLFVAHSRMEAQEIALNLLNLLLTGSIGIRDSALRILTEITKQNPKKLLMFAPHLMSVVEHFVKYPPHQIRQLMNILAILAHVEGSSDSERFSLEFSILLRKQLTHSFVQTRCLGVLGALATVRQLSLQSRSNEKLIKELLELSWSFVEREEEPCCIFLDELCDIVQFLPIKFCKQFQDILTENFQKSWTQEHNGETESRIMGQAGLKLNIYFDANKEMEKEKLAIVFEEKLHGMSPRAVPSHLRVIRILVEKVHNGDLTDIDAILGCPVLIPDINLYYSHSGITASTFGQKYYLGLYLLLTINFFRESISAFVSQNDAELRIKVWLRLSNVIGLQKIFSRQFHSFHTLPLAYIAEKSIILLSSNSTDKSRKAGRPGKKRKSSAKELTNSTEQDDDSLYELRGVDQVFQKTSLTDLENSIQSKIITPYLRRFDPEVFVLLQFPFFVGEDVDFSEILLNISTTAAGRLRDVERLTPDILILLLSEVCEQTSDTQTNLNILDLKNFLLNLRTHMDSVVAALEASDNNNKEKLEACLRLLFKTISIYFNAISQIKIEEERLNFFRKGITILGKLPGDGKKVLPFSEILGRASNYITKLSNYVTDPSTAMEHLHLLKRIHDSESDVELAKSIESTSELYLKIKWKMSCSQIETILKIWLLKAINPISVMRCIIESLIPEDNSQDLPCVLIFQSCTNANFYIWYRVLISSLSQHCSKYGRKITEPDESFTFWSNALEILTSLVSVSTRDRRRAILVPLLKQTRIFLEIFITSGIKLLPILCKRNPDEAKVFTKSLQSTTRKIQYICEHSKVEKDVVLLNYVPLVKRALEALVFRVREVLIVQGAPNSFWMGSLKHRNLDGEIINSQMYNEVEVDISDDDLSNYSSEDVPPVGVDSQYLNESSESSDTADISDD